MMSTSQSPASPQDSISLNDDEIDLRQVASALSRHRRLIGSITAATVLLVACMPSLENQYGKVNFRLCWKIRTPLAEDAWHS